MPSRKKAAEFTCVICGTKFLSTSTNPPKYCSQLCRSRAAAIKYPKVEAVKKAAQEKWGHDPNEYAEKQKQKTLALMDNIVPVEEPKVKEEQKMKGSTRETLIGMKGIIIGSKMFCLDETTQSLLETLSKTVDVLLEEE